jgi:hypothetical protein
MYDHLKCSEKTHTSKCIPKNQDRAAALPCPTGSFAALVLNVPDQDESLTLALGLYTCASPRTARSKSSLSRSKAMETNHNTQETSSSVPLQLTCVCLTNLSCSAEVQCCLLSRRHALVEIEAFAPVCTPIYTGFATGAKHPGLKGHPLAPVRRGSTWPVQLEDPLAPV